MVGVGIAILPEMTVKDDLSAGRLAPLKWEEDDIEMVVLMIWYKVRWLSPALKAFMAMTREELDQDNR